MTQIKTLEKFKAPLGGQEIELQQIDFVEGGMSMMRIRIREGKRFTIFDIDPATVRNWSDIMGRWAGEQEMHTGGNEAS